MLSGKHIKTSLGSVVRYSGKLTVVRGMDKLNILQNYKQKSTPNRNNALLFCLTLLQSLVNIFKG
ncbi:hypothetical protein C7N43_12485 [Sphingobacteriales bacterium UPWRP_1]|nr:hypothetical protein C7N43_12485 [Sphingobacteriales bacterium UPWRP_1]